MVFGKPILAAVSVVLFLFNAGLNADVLKFKNGDQVKGTFMKKEGGQILFRSDRFGDLSVRETDATVELTAPLAPLVTETEVAIATGKPKTPSAATPKPSAAPPKPAGPAAAATGGKAAPAAARPAKASAAEPQTLIATTVRLGKGFIKWWNGWHGRIAFSASIINDSADRSLYTVEARVKRTWKHDEVQIEPRYDFRKDNNVTVVDIFKASGYWRHTFGENWFVEYRPAYQRDRKSSKAEQLEQQFGAGRHILKSKQYRLQAGVAANTFNTWPLNHALAATEYSQESFFSEAGLTLPWRVTITERGVWYFMGNGTTTTGWQNTFELTKKLTDSLSFSLRHEVRQDNPDPRVADYENTRVLLGFNF